MSIPIFFIKGVNMFCIKLANVMNGSMNFQDIEAEAIKRLEEIKAEDEAKAKKKAKKKESK